MSKGTFCTCDQFWRTLKTEKRALMKRLIILATFLIFAGYLSAQQAVKSVPLEQEKIEWLSWNEAAALMEKEPRYLMVDVYTDWCGWCKRMDATTMQDTGVIKLINEKYYAVKMDGEGREDITFRGRTYSFKAQGNRGYHELPAELMNGKMSYPTLVFLDKNFAIIQPLPGYQQAPFLEQVLAYFGSEKYLNTPFEDFKATYPRQE
jgi:thioredoxin-related protein